MAVFVTGTAFFASVTLLSLIIAVVVLTITLAAGIFGRAIASGIVSHVAKTEPMIHIISGTKEEAYRAIGEILKLKSNDGSPFQVEINGQILIDERRVATRSWLKVAILGVLAEPYDIVKPYRKTLISSGPGAVLKPFLSQVTKTTSRGEVSSLPFHSSDSGVSLLPLHQTESNSNGNNNNNNNAVKSVIPQSVRSIPSRRNTDDGSYQIPRHPVPGGS